MLCSYIAGLTQGTPNAEHKREQRNDEMSKSKQNNFTLGDLKSSEIFF